MGHSVYCLVAFDGAFVGAEKLSETCITLYYITLLIFALDVSCVVHSEWPLRLNWTSNIAVIAPSLWNRLPPSARASLLSSNLSTSLSLLKTSLFLELIEPEAPLFAYGCCRACFKENSSLHISIAKAGLQFLNHIFYQEISISPAKFPNDLFIFVTAQTASVATQKK